MQTNLRAALHTKGHSETKYMVKTLWEAYFTNRLWEFHRIQNLGIVGDKNELLHFEIKGQGHIEIDGSTI